MLEAGIKREDKETPPEQTLFVPIISRAGKATTLFAERSQWLWESYKESAQNGVNDDDASEEHAQVEKKFTEHLLTFVIFTQETKITSVYKTFEAYKVPIAKACAEKQNLTLFSLHHIECLTYLHPTEILAEVEKYTLPSKEEVLSKYPLKPEADRKTFV